MGLLRNLEIAAAVSGDVAKAAVVNGSSGPLEKERRRETNGPPSPARPDLLQSNRSALFSDLIFFTCSSIYPLKSDPSDFFRSRQLALIPVCCDLGPTRRNQAHTSTREIYVVRLLAYVHGKDGRIHYAIRRGLYIIETLSLCL